MVIVVVAKFNCLLGPFMDAFKVNGNTIREEARMFLLYLCERVQVQHANDIDPELPNPIKGSYNPPKRGMAYYFEKHGCQLRVNRMFDQDTRTETKGHDDLPDMSNCTKNYPQLPLKSCVALLFYFCPIHGHCWGYHIIDGSEGRKDPSAALYTHLLKAPLKIFYDFSCGLEEYVMNREAGFFKGTQFYHDVFHGYTHNCPEVYSSIGTEDNESYNTSICEQFNSFMQMIKSSCKKMSQVRFSFILQYFIHRWNEKKADSYNDKVKIASACQQ